MAGPTLVGVLFLIRLATDFNCATFTASASSVPAATLMIWRVSFCVPTDTAPLPPFTVSRILALSVSLEASKANTWFDATVGVVEVATEPATIARRVACEPYPKATEPGALMVVALSRPIAMPFAAALFAALPMAIVCASDATALVPMAVEDVAAARAFEPTATALCSSARPCPSAKAWRPEA